MRAARLHEFGPPEVLRVEETDWPAPESGEVLIRVAASSVNGTDLGLRAGGGPFRLTIRRPCTVGLDVSGVVARLGAGVTAFEVGDPVYSLLGHHGGGAAEFVRARAERVAPAPASLPLADAAAVPLAALTALQALRGGAGAALRPGARVLVNGAAGGIGSFGVQLARHYGAEVTGIARAEKHDFVRSMGAGAVLTPDDFDPSGKGGRWDVIFDTPPSMQFGRVRGALTEDGIYVSTRPFPTAPADVAGLAAKRGPRFRGVMTRERAQDLTYLARLIDAGALRVPVDRRFDLSEIVAAHRYAEGPEVRGKVIVTL